MSIVNLLTQTEKVKSLDQNSANLINMYLTEAQDSDKYAVVAYPIPGMTSFTTSLNGNLRYLYSEHGVVYAIAGSKLYTIASNGTATERGTLNTSSGFAKIAGINDQLLMIDGTNGYTYIISTNTFAVIADADFPQDCIDIECQDEFGLALKKTSQMWVQSAVSDLTNWPALAFASTTGNQNNLVAIASCHRELFLFQDQTTEVWDNVGTSNFTFGRNNSVFIECGCASTQSVAKGDSSLFYLGQTRTGGKRIYRLGGATGYTPTSISTRAIDYQISTYTTVSDAIGFVYQQEGHEFYVITFPTAAVTWVYDITTQVWHQRQSLISAAQTRWRPNSYCYCYGLSLVGDYQSATVFKLDMTTNQENGSAITRTIDTHPFYESGAWIYTDKLQIDFDNTPGSSLSNWNLYVSRDGGRTFGSAKAATPQQDSNGLWHCYWLRLGSARVFVFRIQTSANILPVVLGAWANVRAGASA